MKETAASAATREVAQAVRELRPVPPREVRGYVSELGHLPGLQTALRLCRDIGAGEGLVQKFVRVPDSRVDRAERTVRCRCEALVPFGDLRECPGGCGRWWVADESGAWAARFEESGDGAEDHTA